VVPPGISVGLLLIQGDGVGEAVDERAPEGCRTVDGDHGQVAEEPPQLAPLREAGVDRRDVAVRPEYVVRDGLEIVEEGQVDLGVPEVRATSSSTAPIGVLRKLFCWASPARDEPRPLARSPVRPTSRVADGL
jgi:hypothetical protein